MALEEVQDNTGATDDGTVAADQTLTKLTDAIVAAGGPRYQWREIDPVNDKDGGEPGGNIRVVFLFNPARVSFVDRGASSVNRSTTGTSVVKSHGDPALTLSPGRIDPANPVWTTSRKPLAGEFRFRGKPVFVIANHFNSKGGDQNADGRFQFPAAVLDGAARRPGPGRPRLRRATSSTSTARPTSWCSATSTTSSSARRWPRCGPARPTARDRRS